MRFTPLKALPIFAVVSLLLLFEKAAHAADAATDRLNIVLLLVDDLGWSDIGCYGADLHQTPHIDRLASRGMRFTNGYAAAPICSPTRAAIMTGKHPARVKMTIWHERAAAGPQQGRKLLPPESLANLPRSEITIAEVLRQQGYHTAHIGKWHLGTAAYYPETQGFDINIGGTFWGAPSTFYHPFRGPWSDGEIRYVPGLGEGKPDDYLTDSLTDAALKVIEEAGNRPFFLNMAYHTVHTPIEGKPAYVEEFRKQMKPGQRQQNPDYAAMVKSLDESVGRILAKLREQRIEDRTVVIFTSDNGGVVNRTRSGIPTTNQPLRNGKGSLYEGGIRVPWIVYWPGVTNSGSVSQQQIVSHDLYPTILELAGAQDRSKWNETVDGVSLVPILRDPSAGITRDALYWHFPHYYPTTTPVSAVRAGAWKLIEYFEGDRVELYNLHDDLAEKRNLAESEPQRVNALRRQLRDWLKSTGAGLPVRNPSQSAK